MAGPLTAEEVARVAQFRAALRRFLRTSERRLEESFTSNETERQALLAAFASLVVDAV